ncbi:protein of unknown function [Streptomyces sp. KY75]|nr:protein of unknown function [Streptomyces sp. KY75]
MSTRRKGACGVRRAPRRILPQSFIRLRTTGPGGSRTARFPYPLPWPALPSGYRPECDTR